MEGKKAVFKLLIKEFHESDFPEVLKRDLQLPAADAIPPRKVVTITGPRRTGKTYLFYQIIQGLEKTIGRQRILLINFEDDRITPLSLKDMDNLLEAYFELYPGNKEHQIFLFFDEIQNVAGWETYVRRILDKENVRIYLTGSSAKLLARELSTAMRGRTISYALHPLSFREYLRFRGLEPESDIEYAKERFLVKKLLMEYLVMGGFPEIARAGENIRNKILQEYLDLLIYRDLVERFGIRNTAFLRMLMKYLITNVSNLFSVHNYYQTIRKETPISRDTLMEYVGHLEEIGLLSLLPVFSHSLKIQQVNPRKIHVMDNGLRNAVAFRFSPDEGRLAENLVFCDLQRDGAECFYWKGKREVDFVVRRPKGLEGINVTFGEEITKREKEALEEFKRTCGRRISGLTIITKDIDKTESGIQFVPLWKWLLNKRGSDGSL